jgi:O-antigen/teichoic acid export membrane protein
MIGIIFWGAATHLASAAIVGRMSAEIAAMTLLAQLSQLSFGSNFERFLPVAGDKTRGFVARAYVLCVLVALIISVAYVLLGLGHSFFPGPLSWRVLFVGTVILWTIFSLQDSVLVGLRAARWVAAENIVYSLAKLALLPLFVALSAGEGIFVAWMIPVVVLIVVVNWYIFRSRIPTHVALNSSSEAFPTVREIVALLGSQYATLLVTVIASSVVTLIVIDRLGPVASAHYFIPAQIAGGATIILLSIMRSFVVEASSEPERLPHFARVTLRTLVVLLLPTVVVGVIFAPELLSIFGHNYATRGTDVMRMLLLSIPAMTVTSFYSSFALLDKRTWLFATRQFANEVLFFVVLLILIGHVGILSIGIASLVLSGAEAVIFLPLLIRRYRRAVRV